MTEILTYGKDLCIDSKRSTKLQNMQDEDWACVRALIELESNYNE